MQNRPPQRRLSPLDCLLIFKRRPKEHTFFCQMPREVLAHINRLTSAYYVICDDQYLFETIAPATLPVIQDMKARSNIQKALARGRKLYLVLESNGSRDKVGDIFLEGGESICHIETRDILRYFFHKNYGGEALPLTDINRLLHHIAYGDPINASNMVAKNPALLDQSGYVIGPTGDLIWDVKPFECAFAVGDHHPDMIPKLAEFLPLLENGEAVYQTQFRKYEPALAKIGKEALYPFQRMIDAVMRHRDNDDVNALINQDFTRNSQLQIDAFEFRQTVPHRVITSGKLVCPYASLPEAYRLLNVNWDALYRSANNDGCKIDLVWLLINFYFNRRLSGCEREAYARGYLPALENNSGLLLERLTEFVRQPGHFFEPCRDFLVSEFDSFSGCGRSFGVSVYGGRAAGRGRLRAGGACGGAGALQNLCRAKTRYFQRGQPMLQPDNRPNKTPGCIIC